MSDFKEGISAFAFNVGTQIEEFINVETDNLKRRNQMLEAKILQWYQKTKDVEFANHFGIVTQREGEIQNYDPLHR